MPNVVRWRFKDMRTDEIYTVEINPNEMGSYGFSRVIDFALHSRDDSHHSESTRQARVLGVKAPRQPVDWTFGGVVRSETHHDKLIDWQKRPGKVRVTDHLGRTFEVMMKSLDMTDRRPAGDDTWRFRYTFNCLLLRRVA